MATELRQMLSEMIEHYKKYKTAPKGERFEEWIEYSKRVAPFCSKLCHAAFPENEEKFLQCFGACNKYLRGVRKMPLEAALENLANKLRELGAPDEYIKVIEEAKAQTA